MRGADSLLLSALVGGALVLVLLVAAGWVWLWLGLFRPGWRGRIAALAIQLSIVAFAYGVLRGGPIIGLSAAVFPPSILSAFLGLGKYAAFLEQPLRFAGPVALGVLALCLSVSRLRWWSVAPALLAGLGTMVAVGERVSREAMCREASARGVTTFQRHSLLWSLNNAPREWQFEIHAVASLDGKTLGWSYREMTWYDIPEGAAGNVEDAPDFICP